MVSRTCMQVCVHSNTCLAIPGLALAALLMLFPASTQAQGGPPMITDDPDTPGPGYWEVNVSAVVERTRRERRLEAPFTDVKLWRRKANSTQVRDPPA